MARELVAAQHEAAHVVVGAALGLRLVRAALGETREGPWIVDGFAEFDGRFGSAEGWRLMFAAGVAWERAIGADWRETASADVARLRAMGSGTPQAVEALARAAGALLRERSGAHARVTRALLERDLTGSDVEALAHGEPLETDAT